MMARAMQVREFRGRACQTLPDTMRGEARRLGAAHAAPALSVAQHGAPFVARCLMPPGRKDSAAMRGRGRGRERIQADAVQSMRVTGLSLTSINDFRAILVVVA